MAPRRALARIALAFIAALPLGCDPAPAPPGGDAGPGLDPCATDLDCDDGRYCNGPEACTPAAAGADARGCVPGVPPCMDTQRCIDAEGRCVSSCAVAPDADGDGEDAIECGGADCDDTDPLSFTSNPEVCDDADHDEDCNPATFGDRDADGDGFRDASCCNGSTCGDDCNDRRRDSHPGATEACEGIDNDCDGATDEGLLIMQWPDLDHDLHGDSDATPSMQCPGAAGFSTASDDCDDASPIRHGAQLEICDRIDNDCDGTSDESPVSVPWYLDADGDGFGAPAADTGGTDGVVISCEPVPGYSTRPSDCNDVVAAVNPAAHELCNGRDDDCSGYADAAGLAGGDTEDDDGDQHADMVCGGDDCDDRDGQIHPSADEICNGLDDDCDGMTDGATATAQWYLDRDGDGYGDESEPAIESCEPQPLRVTRGGDCDDGNASIRPRAPDFCDDVDGDCDGSIDENGIRFAYFPDADGDGWGTPDRSSIVFRCTRPTGTSDRTGDCADTDAMRYPTAPERCNAADDDCDTRTDEATVETWYADNDRDGRGAGPAITTCLPSGSASMFSDDCDDTDPTRAPGADEICNGRDDDCDTMVDDGASSSCTRPNATGVCTSGACVLTCAAGFDDCDGLVASGCEIDTRRATGHCGACGVACGPSDTCGTTTPGTCDASPVVMLDGNRDVVAAIRGNGQGVSWGSAFSFLGAQPGDRSQPTTNAMRNVASLAIGGELACLATTGGRAQCWGSNSNGGFGDGTTGGSRAGPVDVPSLLTGVVDVAVGQHHACAVRSDGHVLCWGYNFYGQLGLGDATPRNVPAEVPAIVDAVEVAAMKQATCVRRGTPGAYYVTCWGQANSQGNGTTTQTNSPGTPVSGLPGNVVRFSHGYSDGICAITSDEVAYCWGNNAAATGGRHALPLGTTATYVLTPSSVPLTGIAEISLDPEGGCLRRRSGTATGEVWCWGLNNGTAFWLDGTTTSQNAPVRVGGTLSDAVAVVAGTQRFCAARASGAVVCQGSDVAGALGNGPPLAASTTPVTALGLP